MYITYSTSLIGYIAFTYRKNPDSSEKNTVDNAKQKSIAPPYINKENNIINNR